GMIKDPSYKMHHAMNRFAHSSFEDADIMIFMIDPYENYELDDPIIEKLKAVEVPLFLVINKTDLVEPARILALIQKWSAIANFAEIFPISALKEDNTPELVKYITKHLPEGPVYYPKDQLTDKNERFFISEIIREKILLLYRQEIPYSCEVVIESFKETPKKKNFVSISATIYASRKTQKSIIIGKDGVKIKQLGIEARKDIEAFLQKRSYLELHVKVKENWRDNDSELKHFGYNNN
ncbi:MAG: GTPase Era, partial [Saprospiraceae bacterium]